MSYSKCPLTGPFAHKLDQAFGIQNSFYRFQPGNLILPPYFADIAQNILDAPVRSDDVWLISYPKTGSTWLQEIVWLIGNNLDFDKAKNTIQQLRAPMIELSTYLAEYEEFIKSYGNSVNVVNNWPSPRFIKTHLPVDFLPKQIHEVQPKIIYIMRHPKDLCVSYYHHCQLLHHMNSTFENFAEIFLAGVVPLGPVIDHYLGYWKMRNETNVILLKYEDFKRDTKREIERIAEFLDKKLSDDEIDKIIDFLSVENMRNNPGCNFEPIIGKSFVRKGQVGDWKNYMSAELSLKFDKWIEENLSETGLYIN